MTSEPGGGTKSPAVPAQRGVGCAPRQHMDHFPVSAVCEQRVLHGLQGLSASTGFAVRFVPISRNRASHTQTNVMLLWGVRGVAGFVDFFFFFLVLFFLPHDVGLLYMKPEARLFVTSVVRAVKSK